MKTETEMNDKLIKEANHYHELGNEGEGKTSEGCLSFMATEIILNKARQQGAKAERERIINELIGKVDIPFTAGIERDKLRKWLTNELKDQLQ